SIFDAGALSASIRRAMRFSVPAMRWSCQAPGGAMHARYRSVRSTFAYARLPLPGGTPGAARLPRQHNQAPRMIVVSTANVLIALAVTTAAGLATGLGGLLVFTQKAPNARLLAFGLAFAGGAMVYVSLSEILNKSILSFSQGYGDRIGFSLGTLAFLAGVGLIMLIDRLVPNPHERLEADDPYFREQNTAYLKRVGLLTAVAITVHNLPEGLATFFATLENPGVGLPLAFAIAIHN